MAGRWDDYYDDRRVCLIPLPRFPRLADKKRDIGVYFSGVLFAVGWWFFIDAVVYAATMEDPPVTIKLEDWISGIFSTLGMIIVNSIDKSRLTADDFTYSGSGIAWKARLFLFVGFACMAGGLAGSLA
ncbi:1976_t:CDS:2, partial [Paraglomus occultum]